MTALTIITSVVTITSAKMPPGRAGPPRPLPPWKEVLAMLSRPTVITTITKSHGTSDTFTAIPKLRHSMPSACVKIFHATMSNVLKICRVPVVGGNHARVHHSLAVCHAIPGRVETAASGQIPLFGKMGVKRGQPRGRDQCSAQRERAFRGRSDHGDRRARVERHPPEAARRSGPQHRAMLMIAAIAVTISCTRSRTARSGPRRPNPPASPPWQQRHLPHHGMAAQHAQRSFMPS
ncbi:hypothetical protein [Paenirhodobacter sp.]|uniref:hypothetical protein n=1 Tax=Paenirhodobacter sp. TaxID=1965326 RepID=UPI003B3EB46B